MTTWGPDTGKSVMLASGLLTEVIPGTQRQQGYFTDAPALVGWSWPTHPITIKEGKYELVATRI